MRHLIDAPSNTGGFELNRDPPGDGEGSNASKTTLWNETATSSTKTVDRIRIETALSSSLLYILRTGGVHHSAFSGRWTKTCRQPDHFCMGENFPHQNGPRETSVEVARTVPWTFSHLAAVDLSDLAVLTLRMVDLVVAASGDLAVAAGDPPRPQDNAPPSVPPAGPRCRRRRALPYVGQVVLVGSNGFHREVRRPSSL